ncbi:MAG TPA: hypothetical protein VK338_00565 [Candidatus Nitrosocosmicus sp.]|nr:hypothetical protein [Candidatus Nitrosocosmicus sp.]
MNNLIAALKPTIAVCAGPLCSKATDASGKGISDIFGVTIRLVFIAGGLIMLLFLILGAIQYITSGGDKDKTKEARDKITHAAIGMILLIVVYALWIVLVSDILGIFGPGGAIRLPTLGQ